MLIMPLFICLFTNHYHTFAVNCPYKPLGRMEQWRKKSFQTYVLRQFHSFVARDIAPSLGTKGFFSLDFCNIKYYRIFSFLTSVWSTLTSTLIAAHEDALFVYFPLCLTEPRWVADDVEILTARLKITREDCERGWSETEVSSSKCSCTEVAMLLLNLKGNRAIRIH